MEDGSRRALSFVDDVAWVARQPNSRLFFLNSIIPYSAVLGHDSLLRYRFLVLTPPDTEVPAARRCSSF